MKKKERKYIIGPSIKIGGKKRTKRIRKALIGIGANPDDFEIAWDFNAEPGATEDTKFWLLTDDAENAKFLPVDFAEIIEKALADNLLVPEKKF